MSWGQSNPIRNVNIMGGLSQHNSTSTLPSLTLTTSWQNWGDEISVSNKNNVALLTQIDINDALDVQVKMLGRIESSGTSYEMPILTPKTSTVYIDAYTLQFLNNADQNMAVGFDINNVIYYIQFQARALTTSTTGEIAGLCVAGWK